MQLNALTIADLEALANPATKLVPMRVKHSFAPYKAGEIAGFTPTHALAHLNNDHAELMDPKVQARAAATVQKPKPSVVSSTSVRREKDDTHDPGKVEIPEDWKTGNVIKKIAVAKRIVGGDLTPPEGVKPGEFADQVIENELVRRSAPAQTEPPAE